MRILFSIFEKKKNGFFFLNLFQIINVVVAVATLPVILSNIAIAAYGQWQFILALQALAVVISVPHVTDGSKRGLANGKYGTFFYALIKRAKLLIISSIVFLFLSIYFFFTERTALSFLSGISVVYLFSNLLIPLSIGEYFIAKGEFRFWSIWQFVMSPLSRLGSTVVALATHSIVAFAFFQAFYGAAVCTSALFFLIIKRNLWKQYRRREFDVGCYQYGLKYLPIDVIGAISYKLAEVLIATFLGFTTLAIFSVAKEIRNQISNALKVVGPLFYADFARQNMEKIIRSLQKNLLTIIVMGIPVAILAVFCGVIYIFYLLPAEFVSSIKILFILSIGLPLVIPLTILHTILSAHFRYRALAAAVIIPQLIEIILIIFLGFWWGVIGISIAMAIYSFTGFLFYYLVTIKRDVFIHLVQQSKLFQVVTRWY